MYDFKELVHIKTENQNCISLWRAVVAQALRDLKYWKNTNNMTYIASNEKEDIRKIRLWFDLKNKDFCLTCELASYTPDEVIKLAKEVGL